MIFHSSIKRELSRSFGATTIVLVIIVMTIMMYRTLGFAARGSVDPKELFLIMGLSVLGHIPTLLALSLLVCVISVFGRMLRDSETVIWLSSGQSAWQFLRPIGSFAWPIITSIAALSLFVWPWANAYMHTLKETHERRGDLQRIVPGQFQHSASGNRVFYVDRQGNTLSAHNALIINRSGDRETIAAAQTAEVESLTENGVRHRALKLTNGQLLEHSLSVASGDPEKPALVLTQFDTLHTVIGDAVTPTAALPAKSTSSWRLASTPNAINMGELSWRISLPLAALNFALMALTLTIGQHWRAARSAHLGYALLIFIIYYNFINVVQAWIGSGKVNAILSMTLLHGSVFVLALLGLRWRLR